MVRNMKIYDSRQFKLVKATRIGNSGHKYKVETNVRTLYKIYKKKSETDWPSVTKAGSKALRKMCKDEKTACKKKITISETTNGNPKKLWFYEGVVTPKSKSEIAAFSKKYPKLAANNRVPKVDIKIKLIANTELNHPNPLRGWK